MLRLLADLVYTYVKRWLGAGDSWASANAVFRVRLRETLAGCREQLGLCKCCGVHARETLGKYRQVTAGPLQMLCLSGDFVYTYVKRWLGAGNNWSSAHAVPVSGFRVQVTAGPLQMLSVSADFAYTYVKRWLGAGNSWASEMLCLSADFVYTYAKRWLGAGDSWSSANAVPVSGFRVHVRVMLDGCRSQPGPCKCFAWQRISCTAT
eukprot:s3500_g1.t1